MTAREIARAALDLADEALALAERKDSCTGGQRRALADLEFEYAINIPMDEKERNKSDA